MSNNIFLSYASEQSDAASAIALALTDRGHSVFHDRSSLPAGEAFDARIQEAIEECDLLVFLISHGSVASGRYTLTELKFAEHKWPHPAGHVLPVLVEAVPKSEIPTYLRAVTLLQARGNLTAEVAAEVDRMTAPWWRRMLKPRRLVPAIMAAVIVALAASWLVERFKRRELDRKTAELVKQSQTQADSGNTKIAQELLDRAKIIAPESASVTQAEEKLVMQQLRAFGLTYSSFDRSFFDDLNNRVAPVLTRGAASAQGERLANLRAHLGWADYLRQLGGIAGDNPATHYRRAVEADPNNFYAHAMWGFELLRRRRSPAQLAEAKRHFAVAIESKRERDYLRRVQIAGFMQSYSNVWMDDPERQVEALKVVNEMRLGGENFPKGWGRGTLSGKLWSIYDDTGIDDNHLAALLTGLPAKEQLALFQWLFPENELTPKGSGAPSLFSYLITLAQLQEHSGARAEALDSYRRLLREFSAKGYDGAQATQIANRAKAAIKRLSS